jgi:hypothetical protein
MGSPVWGFIARVGAMSNFRLGVEVDGEPFVGFERTPMTPEQDAGEGQPGPDCMRHDVSPSVS